jgi:hypothetical protein
LHCTTDSIVLRYLDRGRPVGAVVTRVISTEDGPVLWLAPGTTVIWPAIAGRRVHEYPPEERYALPWDDVVEAPWRGDGVLILGRPGRAHSLWLFWENDRFAGWYVQLEDPWRPFRFGFDTADHALDIWVGSDGSWQWKDEDELEVAAELGYFTPQQAASIRAEGERVLAEWPFPTGWEDWQADATWPLPVVPREWRA